MWFQWAFQVPGIFTDILTVRSKSLPGNYCGSGPQRALQCRREGSQRVYALPRLTDKSYEDYLDTIWSINLVFNTQDFLDLTSTLWKCIWWEAEDWRGLQRLSESSRWSECWQNETQLFHTARNEFGNAGVAEKAGREQNSLGFGFDKYIILHLIKYLQKILVLHSLGKQCSIVL